MYCTRPGTGSRPTRQDATPNMSAPARNTTDTIRNTAPVGPSTSESTVCVSRYGNT